MDARQGSAETRDLYDFVRNSKPTRDTLLVDSKDVEQNSRGRRQRAESYLPSSLPDARFDGQLPARWPTCRAKRRRFIRRRKPSGTSEALAMVLGLKPENVRVIFRRGSGCYGCNGADAVTYDAALLSQAVGKPVKVQLSRKDEMAWGENYGFAFVMDERAGLDAQGNIIAWDHESWSPVRGNRPGMTTPGNVVSGMLAGFETEPFIARSPAPEPTAYNNGTNGVPSYFAGQVGGSAKGTGTITVGAVADAQQPVAIFYRAAALAGAPAKHLRARMLHGRTRGAREGRSGGVPAEASERCAVERRREGGGRRRPIGMRVLRPKPQHAAPAWSPGRGIACVAYEGDNGYAAMVAGSRSGSGHRKNHRETDRRQPTTAARSRIPTGSAIRSKAARCKA